MAFNKHTEEASCQGKIKYDSAKLAMDTITQRNINKRNSRKNVKSYKCKFCGFFHVGHAHKTKMQPYKKFKL